VINLHPIIPATSCAFSEMGSFVHVKHTFIGAWFSPLKAFLRFLIVCDIFGTHLQFIRCQEVAIAEIVIVMLYDDLITEF
jgi:hypothetical protein